MLIHLKQLREEAGISQKTLADAVGVSQQSINKYENHKIEPDISTMIRIADYFDTSVDYLIGHTDKRNFVGIDCSAELSLSESSLLLAYRKLPKTQADCILHLMKSMIDT